MNLHCTKLTDTDLTYTELTVHRTYTPMNLHSTELTLMVELPWKMRCRPTTTQPPPNFHQATLTCFSQFYVVNLVARSNARSRAYLLFFHWPTKTLPALHWPVESREPWHIIVVINCQLPAAQPIVLPPFS